MSDASTKVDEVLTRKVADLARLELSPSELKTYASQLEQILGYVAQLQSVPVRRADGSEVAPLYTPLELNAPLREDESREIPRTASGEPLVLSCAPEVVESGFKVPQVI